LSRPRTEPYVTYAEYLAQEESSDEKLEYYDGRVYLMTGGTPEHAAISANVVAILHRQLTKCRVYSADLRVRVRATGLATHPDVTVVCGKAELDPEDANAITNPSVVVEVLSPSTERYDRNEKFAHYRQIPSLSAYVLISPLERRVEVYARADDGTWILREVTTGAARLEAIGADLPIDDVYFDPL
jgi:Uma2 family endonuclease